MILMAICSPPPPAHPTRDGRRRSRAGRLRAAVDEPPGDTVHWRRPALRSAVAHPFDRGSRSWSATDEQL